MPPPLKTEPFFFSFRAEVHPIVNEWCRGSLSAQVRYIPPTLHVCRLGGGGGEFSLDLSHAFSCPPSCFFLSFPDYSRVALPSPVVTAVCACNSFGPNRFLYN